LGTPTIERNKMRKLMGGGLIVLAGITMFAGSSSAGEVHEADCYTHGIYDNTSHGYVTNNGTTVVLNTFNPAWEQDHWESIKLVGRTGEVFVHHPAPGNYSLELNGKISSWEVCKGYDPEVEETTTTPVEETTTTIQDTTTIPSSTVVDSTSSTVASVITTSSTVSVGIPPVPPVESVDSFALGIDLAASELPHTGRGVSIELLFAFGLLIAGIVAVFTTRRGVNA